MNKGGLYAFARSATRSSTSRIQYLEVAGAEIGRRMLDTV